jgi:dynein heavy chain
MGRCHDAHAVVIATRHFSRLDKVDVGGPRGEELTAAARHLHAEYCAAAQRLGAVGGDPLDVDDGRFPGGVVAWQRAVTSLEMRLAALLLRALEGAPGVEASARVLESFEGLAERAAVAAQLEGRHVQAVRAFTHELRQVPREPKSPSSPAAPADNPRAPLTSAGP